jgi:hypothetical protein
VTCDEYNQLLGKLVADVAPDEPRTVAGMTKAERFMNILLDLDRCEHGRHEGDVCLGCGGPSVGNTLICPGETIGFGLDGGYIVMPSHCDKYEPEAWRRPHPDAVA